jgi:hypothetical protein
MNITIAEMFLMAWAVLMTVLWQKSRFKHEQFKFETIQVCKAVAEGVVEFVIVDDYNVTIKRKEKSNVA